MPMDQVQKLLEISQKSKRKGIYAIQYKNTLEFVNIDMSTTQLKEYLRQAKKQGIKVFYNK